MPLFIYPCLTMKKIQHDQLKQILEAAVFVYDGALSLDIIKHTLLADFSVSSQAVNKAMEDLTLEYAHRGIHLVKVASGWRFQSSDSLGPILSKLWQEPPPRYSRALMETLSLIAYKQPITRGEIEEIRGVAVSSNIIKTLTEREWIAVVGHKEVPGRPALYATTQAFLDYFSFQSLAELPDSELFEDA